MHVHERCGAVSISRGKSFMNGGYECTVPQANHVATCSLAGDINSEDLTSGSQVCRPVPSCELGFDTTDYFDL